MARFGGTHLLLVVGAVVVVHAGVIAHRRTTHAGDFDISRELGRRFLTHEELYAGGLHYPYMPAAAMYFAPLAVVPAPIGFALRYAVALACLALTLRWLERLARPWLAQRSAYRVPLAAATLLLSAHYVIRDLDDGGPHLILLALLVGGLLAASRNRLVTAGVCIGLATAVKAPHGLLLPFFWWIRQRRLAFWTALAAAAWIAMPALWMGPASWWRHQSQWMRTATASLAADPVAGAAESERRIQNQSLTAVASRYARRWQPAATGRTLAFVAALTVLAVVAWCTRRARPAALVWLPHASAVLIAALLLSPATWVQHLVLMVPALYYIVARQWGGTAPAQPLVTWVLGLYVILALVLNRDLLGRARYLTLLEHGLHTSAMLLVLFVALRPSTNTSR